MKNMKKIIVIAMVAIMCFALAACGGKKETDALQRVKDNGKLVIATSPDFPPFENLEDGKVVGIEIELMEKIAAKMGVELEIAQMNFDSVLPGVQAGKYDVGVSGITVTEDRKKNVLFTTPYFSASQAIVVLKDSAIKSKADLTGKTISVQTGTTAEQYCMSNGYTVKAFEANNDACNALTSGKVDAWVVDNEVAIDLSAKTNGATVVLGEAMTYEPYAFALKKGSDTLVAEMDKILKELIADGTVKSLFDKYDAVYVAPQA